MRSQRDLPTQAMIISRDDDDESVRRGGRNDERDLTEWFLMETDYDERTEGVGWGGKKVRIVTRLLVSSEYPLLLTTDRRILNYWVKQSLIALETTALFTRRTLIIIRHHLHPHDHHLLFFCPSSSHLSSHSSHSLPLFMTVSPPHSL